MNTIKSNTETCSKLLSCFSGASVLITGGFGFVGSRLAHTLLRMGAIVTLMDRQTSPEHPSFINFEGLRDALTIVQGDISNAEQVRELLHNNHYHFIMNLAATSVIERAAHTPYDTILTNTLGWVNIMESARTAPTRPDAVLLTSTDKVYGELQGHAYCEDSSMLSAKGTYEAAKLAADTLTATYAEAYNLPTIVLRMCNLFGPGDFNTDYRLIPKAMKNLFGSTSPLPPSLYRKSASHQRDYLYIDDAVHAILLLCCTKTCLGEVYNLPGMQQLTTKALLEMATAAAAKIEDEHDAVRASKIRKNGIQTLDHAEQSHIITIQKQHMNGDKMMQATGFAPTTSIQDGLQQTASFYRNYFSDRAGNSPSPAP